jgi:RimJ/RimL family protein N-acetyltransferase
MRAEVIRGITVRTLRNGDAETIQRVFDRMGPRSRLLRFNGAKNVLSASDLAQLSRVDGLHHVLVGVVDGEPVGIARLVRDGDSAEVAFAVVDDYQGRGVGTVLADRLREDARAAGITSFHAEIRADNAPSQALLQRVRMAA